VLEQFLSYIKSHELFDKNNHLLLAFSGGIDSVVLAHLLKKGEFKFELAHCNFGLRGKESDGDEKFCRELARTLKVKIQVKKFDTGTFAKKEKLSVQMAARKLRYGWFEELMGGSEFDRVLTAHHANDNVETLLINLIRGTGINGLQGIPVKQKWIVRPLLFATKEEILAYAKANKLKFRHDSSNDEVKYKRNFLRHEVIPALKKLNPSLEHTFENNIRLFKQSAGIIKQFVSEKEKNIIENNGSYKINIKKLLQEEARELLLFEFLHPFGFNAVQSEQLFKSLGSKTSGKLFFSETHKALVDRHFIIVETPGVETPDQFTIESLADFKKLPVRIKAEVSPEKKIISNKTVAQISPEKIIFPLKLRKWQKGDKFMPLGMKGFKKVSDFLIGQKLNRFEKENIWLLLNKDEVIWVVGYRIDERYKINPGTKGVLKLELLKNQ
jgi:tRNA(Ile)-lysidine synthase